MLASKGFAQYEISAYAKSEKQCKHNLNYWQFGDYLGLGAGAHGKITDGKQIRRFARHRLPSAYMEKAGSIDVIVDDKTPGDEDIILEFMMNVLRLNAGFSASLFSAHTGLRIQDLKPKLDIAIKRGFIMQESDCIKPTEVGLNYLNDLLEIFVPATT
jgi:oxygen-independent coproporphyrinogen-3 oxidase